MMFVLPATCDQRPVGSAVLVAAHKQRLLFASALHLFGDGRTIGLALPPHQGNLSMPQVYPVLQAPILGTQILAVDPFADLAILVSDPQPNFSVLQMPTIVATPGNLPVGSDVVVLGYPFAPIGSLLETWTPSVVTALARRQLARGIHTDELVLGLQSHPGMSGAAVVGKHDGMLHGILRGTLAPPEVLKIGNIPVMSDTSVTFATSAHLLHELLVAARTEIDRLP